MAQNTVISGIFIYQKNIEYSIGFYENTLLELESNIILHSKSNEIGRFSSAFNLEEPKIIIFSSYHDIIRIYIKPGDSIYLQIVNRQNIIFSGDHSNENNLLFNEGLSSDIFRSNQGAEKSVDEKINEELGIYTHRKQILNTETFDSDFQSFFNAEIIGRKYSGIYSAIGKDGESIYPEYYTELKKFGDELILNESRSRSYNNCFALMWRFVIKGRMEVNQFTSHNPNLWYWKLRLPERKQLLEAVSSQANLYRLLSYSTMNNLINLSTDTSELQELNSLLGQLSQELPSKLLEHILKQTINEKLRKLKLVTPYNFKSIILDSTQVMLYDYNAPYILLDFWATWCKPCIENMSKLNEFAAKHKDSIIVIAINIEDTKKNWTDWLSENKLSEVIHVKLSHDESLKVFSEYYFESVPNYVLLNEEFKFIINGINKFDPEFIEYIIWSSSQ